MALEIARNAGVDVPDARVLIVEDRSVLLLERFDRSAESRIGYISAMTATGRRVGEVADYLDVVEAIEDHSSQWRHDCAEMFRRMALSVAVHNTDDHLHNHGFVCSAAGCQLSPAFDINPEPEPAVERQIGINGVLAAGDAAEALLDFAPLRHLTPEAARSIVLEVVDTVADCQSIATGRGIP